MLLTGLAEQLTAVVDRLQAPDTVQPSPVLARVLAEQTSEVKQVLAHLTSESAFRTRAGVREPLPPASTAQVAAGALVRSADPVSTALRDLNAAVACLSRADACRDRPPGPARDQAAAFAHQGLVWSLGSARRRLAMAATLLRDAAEPQATPSISGRVHRGQAIAKSRRRT
ncbi:hypothetical protein [Streptomyces seoulensis]|uniref:hypothetical protein n=1 Tax=Streptomyces seoulensis TaxID=73044 RepID=UPI001FCA4EE4|nr:hypothetical protein [Streptomyces seoulensis]BDH07208.1 hypothetical protein HEK131_44350 [Streptomyces seoulensis]